MSLNLTFNSRSIVSDLDDSVNAVFIFQDERIAYANKRFWDIVGYSKEVCLKSNITTILTPETLELLNDNQVIRSKGGQVPGLGKANYIEADGSICSVIYYSVPTTYRGQDALMITIQKQDTDYSNIKPLNRDYSGPQFLDLLESCLAGVIIFSAVEHRVLYVNPVIRRLFGLNSSMGYDSDFTPFIHPDYRDFILNRYSRRISGDRNSINYRFKALDHYGHTIWLEGNFHTVDFRGERAIMANLRDVTAKINRRNLVNANPEQLAIVFNGLDIGVSITDMESCEIIFLNDYYTKMLGPFSSQLCCEYLFHDNSRCQNCQYIQPIDGESICETRSSPDQVMINDKCYQFLRKNIIWEDNRSVLLTVAIDITAQTQVNQAKNDFLARMSHEIRTPIGGIIGFADLLSRERLEQKQMESVKMIQNCSEQLLRLVNDILDLSKIEAGKISLDLTEFSLRRLIDESLSIVSSEIKNKGLNVSIKIDPDMPQAYRGDANRIKQVLNNLLSNSVKFTQTGEITISAAESVERSGNDNTYPLMLVVQDTGVGMTNAEQEHIFEPFTQADCSTTRRFGGTGLGLTISRSLVELMGGTIWLTSIKNSGTTVSCHLPLEPILYEQITTGSETEDDNQTVPKISVLVVEDIEVNQKLLTYMLEKFGCTSIVASNGYECLSYLEQIDFDLVLMDMQMPIMNGYDTTRYIRDNHLWDKLPIVALTAHAMQGDKEKCLSAGCNYYLPKPFTVDQLKTAITTCIAAETSSDDPNDDIIDPAVMEELKKEFFVSLSEMVTTLKTALARKDIETMRSITHDIKGTAGLYGYHEIAELASDLYKKIRMSCSDSFGAIVSDIDSTLHIKQPNC